MRTALFLGLVILVSGAVACTAGGAGGEIDWVKDPDAGLEEASSEGRPAALLFTADW